MFLYFHLSNYSFKISYLGFQSIFMQFCLDGTGVEDENQDFSDA